MFGLIPFNRDTSANVQNLFSYLDNIERSFFGPGELSVSQFRTDIKDNGNEYLLEAELPGFTKGDINIDVKEDLLTITAKHEEQSEHNEDSYVRKERKYGAYSRSFDISGIQGDQIAAGYDNGLLTLHLPKKQLVPQTTRRIDIG